MSGAPYIINATGPAFGFKVGSSSPQSPSFDTKFDTDDNQIVIHGDLSAFPSFQPSNETISNNNNTDGTLERVKSFSNSGTSTISRSRSNSGHASSHGSQRSSTHPTTPLAYNSSFNNITIRSFKHSRPIAGTNYFSQLAGLNGGIGIKNIAYRGGLSVLITIFNEPSKALEDTLQSLYVNYQYLCKHLPNWSNRPFNVCIIQDGWHKCHESMKIYLKNLFPKTYKIEKEEEEEEKHFRFNNSNINNNTEDNRPLYWCDYFKEFQKYNKEKQGPITYIFESKNMTHFNVHFSDEIESGSEAFDITLIVKIDNRRKHNSHEWFMGNSGFCQISRSKYFLAVDAFTKFSNDCVYHLVKYLENNPNCCACTGRKRGMSRSQQNTRGQEFALSMQYILRQTQKYDFENYTSVYTPIYSFLGYVICIDGACGMYRTRDIIYNNAAMEWYLKVTNFSSDPNSLKNVSLALANLGIAEDLVLTQSAMLKNDLKNSNTDIDFIYPKCTKIVYDAIYYFECELSLESLLSQRRRWLNSALCGCWYILFENPKILWQGWIGARWINKLMIAFLQFCTLIAVCAGFMSPGLSLTLLKVSLHQINIFLYHFNLVSSDGYDINTILIEIVMFMVWILFIAHIIVHNQVKYNAIIMQFLYLLSIVINLALGIASVTTTITFFVENPPGLYLYKI